MQLINCSDKPMDVSISGRPPLAIQNTETVFPARTFRLEPKVLTTLTGPTAERDRDIILEQRGPQGIVEPRPGEALEATIRRGRDIRCRFLTKQIIDYRRVQALKQASGAVVDLPPDWLRDMFVEVTALRAELMANDPVLHATLPDPSPKPLPDGVEEQMRAMGFGGTSPAAPGVPDALSGVTGGL